MAAPEEKKPFRLCLVTSGNLALPPLLDKVSRAVEGGLDAVELREKDRPGREVFEMAEALSARLADRARLLINDRADVALAVPGAGLHLPGQGLPLADARRLLGSNRLIGVSVHSTEEAVAAARAGADYIFFGPVFDTPSKRSYGAPQGLLKLRDVAAAVDIPVIAIGGIVPATAARVREHGAAGVAVMSYILDSPDPAEAACRLTQAWKIE